MSTLARHVWGPLATFWVAAAVLLPLGDGCRRGYQSAPGADRQAVAVGVATVERRDMPVEIKTFGQMEAESNIAVRSQVTGTLQEVYFKAGQFVRKGQRLALIDPRPFEAALRQAQANATRDIAQKEYAEIALRRLELLLERKAASRDEVDQARAQARAMEATVKADQAAIETARLQLAYTRINSPADALAGALLIDPGNLVKLNDDVVVMLRQISPMFVNFTVPQGELSDIRREMAAAAGEGRSLTVLALQRGQRGEPARGRLSFINNTVDPNTGTILLKATYENKDRRLWPGAYADVTLVLRVHKGAIVVPSAAVQTGPDGQFVFVVQADKTVQMQPVEASLAAGDLSVVAKGLRPGQMVVTDGQLLLSPGRRIEIKPSVERR